MAGPGPDDIDAADGDDIINSGRGGIDNDPDSVTSADDLPPFRCFDDITGGPSSGGSSGFDIATYADRTGPVTTDLRPGRTFAER